MLRSFRPRTCRACAIALCGGLVLGGCERLFGADDDEVAADADAPEVAEPPGDGEPVPDKDDDDETARAEQTPEDPGETKGDEGDDSEPTNPQDGDEAVVLSEIVVTPSGGAFGAGTLEISAKGKLNERIESGTYVQTKALCKQDDRLLADTALLDSADYTKPVQNLEVGDVADLRGRVFTQGLEQAPAPCQLEFRLAGAGGGVSLPLGFACYDGSAATSGPCMPPIVAAAMSGPGKPLEVATLDVKKPPGFGSHGGLSVNYVLDIRRAQDSSNRISLKLACPVGETKFVEVNGTHLQAGPFKYEPGESVARSSSFFYNPALGLTETPALCDITFALWEPRRGSFGEASQTVLHDACWRGGRVEPGRCERAETEPPEPAPATEDSLELANVQLEVVEPYGSKGDRFQLKVQADATVEQRMDQFASVSAVVTCKVGKTARVETAYLYGVELYYLLPGETTRMTSTAFGSNAMDKQPGSCEAEFMVGRRFSSSGRDAVSLGKWCLRRGKVKPC